MRGSASGGRSGVLSLAGSSTGDGGWVVGVHERPDSISQIIAQASALESYGRTSEAASFYEKALRVCSRRSPDVLAAYGLFVQNSLGDADAAEALYKEALALDPAHMTTLQNYAIFLEEVRGNFDGAELMYNRALESTQIAGNHQHVQQRAQAGNPLSDRGTGGTVASGLPPQLAEIPPELMKSLMEAMHDHVNAKMDAGHAAVQAGAHAHGAGARQQQQQQQQQHARPENARARKIDADIRFAGGAAVFDQVEADKASRHSKEHRSESMHQQPWMGPLDKRPKPRPSPKPSYVPPRPSSAPRPSRSSGSFDDTNPGRSRVGMPPSSSSRVTPARSSGLAPGSAARVSSSRPLSASSGRPGAHSKKAVSDSDVRYDPAIRLGLRRAHGALKQGGKRGTSEEFRGVMEKHGVVISKDGARRVHLKLSKSSWGSYDDFLDECLVVLCEERARVSEHGEEKGKGCFSKLARKGRSGGGWVSSSHTETSSYEGEGDHDEERDAGEYGYEEEDEWHVAESMHQVHHRNHMPQNHMSAANEGNGANAWRAHDGGGRGGHGTTMHHGFDGRREAWGGFLQGAGDEGGGTMIGGRAPEAPQSFHMTPGASMAPSAGQFATPYMEFATNLGSDAVGTSFGEPEERTPQGSGAPKGKGKGTSVKSWLKQVGELRSQGEGQAGSISAGRNQPDFDQDGRINGWSVEQSNGGGGWEGQFRGGAGGGGGRRGAGGAGGGMAVSSRGGAAAAYLDQVSPPRPPAKPATPPAHPTATMTPSPAPAPAPSEQLAGGAGGAGGVGGIQRHGIAASGGSYGGVPASALRGRGSGAASIGTTTTAMTMMMGAATPASAALATPAGVPWSSRSAMDLAELPDANDRFDPESVYNPLTKGDLVDMQNSKFSLLRPSRRSLSPSAPQQESAARPGTARRSLVGGNSNPNSRTATASKAMTTPGGPGLRSLDQLVTRLSEAMTSPQQQQQQQQQQNDSKVSRDEALEILDAILAALRAKCGSASSSFNFLCSHGPEKKHNNATRLVLLTHMVAAVGSLGLGMTRREVSAAFSIMADQRTGAVTQSGLQSLFFRGAGVVQTPSRAVAEQSRVEIGKLTDYAREVWDNSAEAFVFFNSGGGEFLTKKDFSRSLKRMCAPDIDEERLMRELDHDKDDKVGPREFIRMVASGWHSVGDHARLTAMLDTAMAKRGSIEGKLESHVQRTRPRLPMPALRMSGSSEVMSKSALGSSAGARQSPSKRGGGKDGSDWDDGGGDDGNRSSSSPNKGASLSQRSLEVSNMSTSSQGVGVTPAEARRLAAVRIKHAKKKQEEAKKAAKQEEMEARRNARYERIMRRIEEQSQVPRPTFQSGRKSHLRLFRKPEDETSVPYWPAPREGGFTPFMGDWDESPWWQAEAERMLAEEEEGGEEEEESKVGGRQEGEHHEEPLNPRSSGTRRPGIGGPGEALESDGENEVGPKRNVRWSANQEGNQDEDEDEDEDEGDTIGSGGMGAGRRRKMRGRDSDSED